MKILLLRFSSIGDIVLTTPVIRCLRRQTGAEVHFLTKQAFESILRPNPYLERVYTFEKEVDEVLPALKQERYDWVIDLHHNLRSLRAKWALGRPSRAFDKLNFEKWLLVNTGIDRLPDVHIVHRYLDTVRHLGVRYDGAGLDFFIPPEAEIQPEKIDHRLRAGAYTAFVMGATHFTKRLPGAKIADICRLMNTPVVLLGGKAEKAESEIVVAAAGPHVVNTCGQLSLHQSASLVRQSVRVITHDTGLMHIAAAFQRPIVSLWGNTVPEFGMYPFYPDGLALNTTIENRELSCRPCSKIGYVRCPQGHFRCMNDLPVEAILNASKQP